MGNFLIVLGYIVTIIGFIFSAVVGQVLIKKGENIIKKQETHRDKKEIIDSVEANNTKILKEMHSLRIALERKGIIEPEAISKELQNEFQILTNRNANLSSLSGMSKEGGVAIVLKWTKWNKEKVFLADILGALNKNRISLFIDTNGMLICQIFPSNGRKEVLTTVDIRSWKYGESHVIFLQWDTGQNKVEVYIDAQPFSKIIPDLHFDSDFGNLLFTGTDFEGNHRGVDINITPADIEKMRQAFKAIGLNEHKEDNTK